MALWLFTFLVLNAALSKYPGPGQTDAVISRDYADNRNDGSGSGKQCPAFAIKVQIMVAQKTRGLQTLP